jgi:hypothetical protein
MRTWSISFWHSAIRTGRSDTSEQFLITIRSDPNMELAEQPSAILFAFIAGLKQEFMLTVLPMTLQSDR